LKYLVYRFDDKEKQDLSDANNIIALTKGSVFIDKDGGKNYRYVVTALDRLWNESEKSNTVELVAP
jgi:nitrate reductase assembly molybdenum cofactor insertion protein NarJ